MVEGSADKKATVLNKNGKVRRFWYSNRTYNRLSAASGALGVVGVGLSAHRIATAKNPLKEAAIVTTGYVASSLSVWITSKLGVLVAVGVTTVTGNATAGAVIGQGVSIGISGWIGYKAEQGMRWLLGGD